MKYASMYLPPCSPFPSPSPPTPPTPFPPSPPYPLHPALPPTPQLPHEPPWHCCRRESQVKDVCRQKDLLYRLRPSCRQRREVYLLHSAQCSRRATGMVSWLLLLTPHYLFLHHYAAIGNALSEGARPRPSRPPPRPAVPGGHRHQWWWWWRLRQQ